MPARNRHRERTQTAATPASMALVSSLPAAPSEHHVDSSGLDRLADLLQDPERDKPVVIMSRRRSGETSIPPQRVIEVLGDLAHVRVLASFDTGWDLDRIDNKRYTTYGGAIRVVERGGWDDTMVIHRPGDDDDEALERIRRACQHACRRMARALPPSRGPRRALTHRLPAEAVDLLSQMRDRDEAPKPGSALRTIGSPEQEKVSCEPTMQRPERPSETEGVEPPVKENQPWAKQIEDLTLSNEILAAETTELRADMADLNKKINRLTHIVSQIGDAGGLCDEDLFNDPAQQARYDIEQVWLRHLPPADRDQHPMRRYVFGVDFLDSLNDPSFQLANRQQILAAAVDVLTRRAYANGRKAHPQLAGEGGRQVMRHDGASAYRCTIITKSGGPRLLWWELTDGTVELARVAHHDDHKIR